MAARRRRTKTPRLALVDFGQLKRLEHCLDLVEGQLLQTQRLVDDLLTLKGNRKGAAQRAADTRRNNANGADRLPKTAENPPSPEADF
jgi:hypothetical protein